MNVDGILKLLRGAVRPVTLFAVVGGVVGLAIYYGVTVNAKEAALFLAAFSGPIIGFWFKERGDLPLPDEPPEEPPVP